MISIWTTKEWREARKKWDNGEIGSKKDKCEQEYCNSTIALSPHHNTPLRQLLNNSLREFAIKQMCKEMEAKVYPSSLYGTGGFACSKGRIKVKEFKTYIKDHPEFKEEAEKKAKEEYFSFKDTITLCKRCHFAIEHGMKLCYYCKEKYHRFSFPSCGNPECREKVKKAREKEEKEYEQFEKEVAETEREMQEELEKNGNKINYPH